ncbi:MAG: sigma 54-interacting transcriptional regulator [Calditrichia bacterium]
MRFRMAVITENCQSLKDYVELLNPFQADFYSLEELEPASLSGKLAVLLVGESFSPIRCAVELINNHFPKMIILISCPHRLPNLNENSYQLEGDLSADNQLIETVSQRIVTILAARTRKFGQPDTNRPIIAVSRAMRNIMQRAKRIAFLEEPVLICGETGTGKDLLASHIHSFSSRKSGPYHVVNCAAISPQLFDSEFFGHMKGAFTGASRAKTGHFAYANGGTLILDEIGELDINLQAKLLRAIDNNEIMPVGSHERKKIDIRIIALTNRELRKEIQQGKFREDLFHRLNALQLNLPPLRNRPSDVITIAKHILEQTWVATIPGWKSIFTEEVCRWLCARQFSGNVRQLRNLLLGVLVTLRPYDIRLTISDLEKTAALQGVNPKEQREALNLAANLREVETRLILRALEENEKNITTAARHLGITRQNLQQRMRKLNM